MRGLNVYLKIKEVIEEVSGIKDLSYKSRKTLIIDCRCCYYHLSRYYLGRRFTQEQAGRYCGKRTHATVINGLIQFDNNYDTIYFTANEIYKEARNVLDMYFMDENINTGLIIDMYQNKINELVKNISIDYEVVKPTTRKEPTLLFNP